MPRLEDLLSDSTDTTALRKLAVKGRPTKKNSSHRRERADESPSLHYIPDFVAVDLETTGLNNSTDRIIEIGAVKFCNRTVREEFSTTVNPGIPIPPFITDLTGLSESDVSGSPVFTECIDRLLDFIGDMPVCGHQVDFDINFLNAELVRAGRQKLSNYTIDTVQLARIVPLTCAGYSLTAIAEALELKLDKAHRALDDARASGMAAVVLFERLLGLKPALRVRMARFAPPSVIRTVLNRSNRGKAGTTSGEDDAPKKLPPIPPRLSAPESFEAVEHDAVEAYFRSGGFLDKHLRGFQPREEQTSMALTVVDALNSGCHAVIEAGTGTGKSLAYLVPSMLHALRNTSRVFITTHTRNLQDQLIGKELPCLRRCSRNEMRYAVLKGRGNYICQNRWERLLRGEYGTLSRWERIGVLALLRWLDQTKTGDIAEQSQFNPRQFSRIWNCISSDARVCEGRRCRHSSDCFVNRARLIALGSHIVVINHALFFSDLCAETSFLGPPAPIIFDEAHHLRECGHRFLRVEVDSNRFSQLLELLGSLVGASAKEAAHPEIAGYAKQAKKVLKQFRKRVADFQAEVLLEARRAEPGRKDDFQISWDQWPFQENPHVAGMNIAFTELQDVLRHMEERGNEEGILPDAMCCDIVSARENLSQLHADVNYTASGSVENHVFWAEGNHAKAWIKLCGVPLDVGEVLGQVWERLEGACVFTSATMMIDNRAHYFASSVGLRDGEHRPLVTGIYPSPFSASQMARCAVSFLPEPDEPAFVAAFSRFLGDISVATKKSMLVLFTSHGMLRNVYSHLKAMPEVNNAGLIAQGITGNRSVALELFRNRPGAILLGADSFWEGIDAPGSMCEIVCIARLPFAVPTHPLTRALFEKVQREEGNAFSHYSLPEACVKFRQGTGRLIRGPNDAGALVVCDSRIVSRPYGKRFQMALNGAFHRCASAEETISELNRFFSAPSGVHHHQEPRYVPVDEC